MLAFIAGALIYGVERAVRVEGLGRDKESAEARAVKAEEEADRLQARWDHLLDVECRDSLWKRSCSVTPPLFVPKLNRKTRFLTVLNLKGGVGKTTMTANLAACLAADKPSLRVLLIDIDFQGTLSAAAVDPEMIRLQHQNDSIVNSLLTTLTPDASLITRLAVQMNEVKGVGVILARDTLDATEFQLQARFLLNPSDDPRFRFRSHMHQPEVFEMFDLVIFDCPPRVTTSLVNAVASSDYVLIPTKLDDGSIDAVPRTVAWMKSLNAISQADVIGVVASHTTTRDKKLIKSDQQSYDRLGGVVQLACGEGLLFAAHIEQKKEALGPCPGTVASVTAKGRVWYTAVAAELRTRMKL